MRSAQFTLDYANTTSSLHNSLKTNATNQVGYQRKDRKAYAMQSIS